MLSDAISHTNYQLPNQSGSDVANVIASKLEPRQLPNWKDSNKITLYDASSHALQPDTLNFLIHPSIIITGCDFRYLSMNNLAPYKHKLRYIKLHSNLIIKSTSQTKTIELMLHCMAGAEFIALNEIDFHDLTTIPIFQKLREITIVLCFNLNKILICCPKIQTLIVNSFGLNLNDLKYYNELRCLKICGTLISNIDALVDCPHLRKIELNNIKYLVLPASISKLKVLILKNIKAIDVSCLAQYYSLRYLRLEECTVMGFPSITRLQKLVVRNCHIKQIILPSGCPNLECIKLEKYTVNNMIDFEACTKLKRIVLTDCTLIKPHFANEECFLHSVIIDVHINSIIDGYTHGVCFIGGSDIDNRYKDCVMLKIINCSLQNLDRLISYKRLTVLRLDKCYELENINGLKECPDVETISIANCPKLMNLSGLQKCLKLRSITIDNNTGTMNLMPLANCVALKRLSIFDWVGLIDFSSFPICGVDIFEIMECPNLMNIDGLCRWDNLLILSLQHCRKLKSISMLKQITKLRVKNCGNLEDISNLTKCEELIDLRINGCDRIQSIPEMKMLQILWLDECVNLENISKLFQCEQLIDLHVNKYEKINANELEHLMKIVDERKKK